MALRNKKYNAYKNAVQKKFLTDSEMMAFVSCAVKDIIDNHDEIPYYVNKRRIINTYTVNVYLGESAPSLEYDNYYEIVKEILEQIDIEQYYEILDDIEDGIKYELSKRINVLGDIKDINNETNIKELNELVDKIGVDKISKLLQLEIDAEAVDKARNEVKKK